MEGHKRNFGGHCPRIPRGYEPGSVGDNSTAFVTTGVDLTVTRLVCGVFNCVKIYFYQSLPCVTTISCIVDLTYGKCSCKVFNMVGAVTAGQVWLSYRD